MAIKKRVVIDFKDTYNCTIKYNGKKKIVPKKEIMKKIIDNRLNNAIKITPYWQLFRNVLYLDNEVCKYVIISKSGGKIVIKNVYYEDLYYDDLEALSNYRAKVITSEYDYHPSFRNEDNWEFENPDSKKR